MSEYTDAGMKIWPSTQSVTGFTRDLTQPSGLPANKIEVDCQYMGGGFGSKFGPDLWGVTGVTLSKKAGKPVKLLLERDLELMIAGNRPSAFADVKVACDKDGVVTAWESKAWGSGGLGGFDRAAASLCVHRHSKPFYNCPANQNKSRSATGMACAESSARLFYHNVGTGRSGRQDEDGSARLLLEEHRLCTAKSAHVYREELELAAQLFDYKSKYHPARRQAKGPMKRGVGISMHTWAGAGHGSNCDVTINPDGSVAAKIGTQDLGVGTRTCVGIVVADSLGLPLEAVKVNIGNN